MGLPEDDTGFPCSTGFPHCVCSRNPSVLVHQLASLWEAVFSFSEYFWRLKCICPFHDGLITSTPALTVLSVWPKTACLLPHAPRSLFTRLCPGQLFLFLWMKKSSKGNIFWIWNDETKNGRSTKRHQNQQDQKLFGAVDKNVSIASNGEYFEV